MATIIWIVLIHLVCFQEIERSIAANSCNSNADCSTSSYCCRGIPLDTDRSCQFVTSCLNRFCKSNRDCNGPGECCGRRSRCTIQCQSCQSDDDCASRERCCFSEQSGRRQCSVNCPRKYCPDRWACTGALRCCRSNVCVNCSTSDCRQHGECPIGKYCCRKNLAQGERYCDNGCLGGNCNVDGDCAGRSECCYQNKCVPCSLLLCNSNSDCKSAYCCKGRYFEKPRCMPGGCIGKACRADSDCGGPGECCRHSRCVKCIDVACKTNSDCGSGGYCCGSSTKSWCNTSCIGNACVSNTDCADPVEECTYPDSDCVYHSSGKTCPENPVRKCFHGKGCGAHDDCNIFGKGYSCCRERNYIGRSCNSNCINKRCDEDSECASGECCDSAENRCRKCPAYLPSWLIGITIGVAVLVLAVVVGMVRCIYVWHNCRGTAGQRPSPQGAIAMQRRQNDNHESVNGPTVGGFGQTPQSTERQEVASPSQIVPQCAIPPPGNEMHVRDAPHVAPVPALSSDPPPSYESLFGNS